MLGLNYSSADSGYTCHKHPDSTLSQAGKDWLPPPLETERPSPAGRGGRGAPVKWQVLNQVVSHRLQEAPGEEMTRTFSRSPSPLRNLNRYLGLREQGGDGCACGGQHRALLTLRASCSVTGQAQSKALAQCPQCFHWPSRTHFPMRRVAWQAVHSTSRGECLGPWGRVHSSAVPPAGAGQDPPLL